MWLGNFQLLSCNSNKIKSLWRWQNQPTPQVCWPQVLQAHSKASLFWLLFSYPLLALLLSVTGFLHLFLQGRSYDVDCMSPFIIWSGCQMFSSKVIYFKEFHVCLFDLGSSGVFVCVRRSRFGEVEVVYLFFFLATKRNNFLFSLDK